VAEAHRCTNPAKWLLRGLAWVALCALSAGLPDIAAARQGAVIDARYLLPPLAFSLVDDNGRRVTAQDYRGNGMLLVFGYTACGNSCPLVLTKLVSAVRTSGVSDTRIVFVTVAPRNDSPPVLKWYLAAYGSRQLSGLTGDRSHLEALARRLRAAFPVLSGQAPVHSDSIYIFDKSGHALAVAASDIAEADLEALIRRSVQ